MSGKLLVVKFKTFLVVNLSNAFTYLKTNKEMCINNYIEGEILDCVCFEEKLKRWFQKNKVLQGPINEIWNVK